MYCTEVTRRKHVEEEIRKSYTASEERYRDLLERRAIPKRPR